LLTPRKSVPDLELPLTDGGIFALSQQSPENFTMLVFYRGKHCPICHKYLGEIAGRLGEFAERGVTPFAISMDDHERAMVSRAEWETGDVPLAYGLSEADARAWGLYISSKREGTQEPDVFSEPGLFLVRPDMTLYLGQTQSVPFTRPSLDQLLQGIDFALKNDYPARGDLT
jgi:peroxiredoxin